MTRCLLCRKKIKAGKDVMKILDGKTRRRKKKLVYRWYETNHVHTKCFRAFLSMSKESPDKTFDIPYHR